MATDLVVGGLHDRRMVHHPWRWLRDHFPDWEVEFSPRRPGELGNVDIDEQRIYLEPGMMQPQKRATLDHELRHARDGDRGCQHPKREAQINRESAAALIPFYRLVDACVWSYDKTEAADELWVDLDTLQCRLDNLTDAERSVIRRAIAQRDYHEEGL